jgi:hypothetical protein
VVQRGDRGFYLSKLGGGMALDFLIFLIFFFFKGRINTFTKKKERERLLFPKKGFNSSQIFILDMLVT